MAGSPEADLSQSVVRAHKEGFDVAIINHPPSCGDQGELAVRDALTRAGSRRLVGKLGRIREGP